MVDTTLVQPGDPVPELHGEVVVKPTVSAGARDTGRFSPAVHDEARALIERLTGAGRTAMVQPYLAAVEARGETAIVMFAGERATCCERAPCSRPTRRRRWPTTSWARRR